MTQDVPPPPLARETLDRAAEERRDPTLVDRLRADPATRVLAVHGDRAPLAAAGGLRYVAPGAVRDGVEWAMLGRDAGGRAVLAAITADADASPLLDSGSDGTRWAALRAVGGELAAEDAGIFVEAVSLGRWLLEARFCPLCGTPLRTEDSGWVRRCPGCARQQFPRTDPAVIVAVVSQDGDRLLLGQNAGWRERRLFSAFAGFVEAGESLESAIVREIAEEAGVEATKLEYRGSQAWPYPRSIMLGFHAVAADDAAARADGEEIVELRWFTRDELRAAFAGELPGVAMPSSASIAHTLIRDWCER